MSTAVNLSMKDLESSQRSVRRRRADLAAFDVAASTGKPATSGQVPGTVRESLLEALGDSLINLYKVSKQPTVLEEAIASYEQVLELRPVGHPGRAFFVTDLGNALLTFCELHGQDHTRLRAAVALLREAVDLSPRNHPARQTRLTYLAVALQINFEQHGEDDAMTEVVEIHREVLRLWPPGHPCHSMALNNLASALHVVFENQGGSDTLAEVIALHRQAVLMRSPDDPYRPQSLDNLANALEALFEQAGDFGLLEEAIALHREALQLNADGQLRASSLTSLANALLTEFNQRGGADALAEAVALNREALNLCPRDHPLHSVILPNLATALSTTFAHQGGRDTLAEAITIHRQAVLLHSAGHPLRKTSLSNLAAALNLRFAQQGGIDTLSEVVTLYRESLDLCPPGHTDRGMWMGNLASALLASYKESNDAVELSEAIRLHREALSLRPPGHAFRVASLSSLGDALWARLDKEGASDDLTEAIAVKREALECLQPGHPERPVSLMNLAAVLTRVASENDDAGVWAEVVAMHQEAMRICPVGSPMRALVHSRAGACLLVPDSPTFDMKMGIACFSASLADDFAPVKERLQRASRDLRILEDAWLATGARLTGTAHDARALETLQLYRHAIRLLPRIANVGLDALARFRTLAGSDAIARVAAARALAIGRLHEAVEMLEEGRGVFWAQSLRLRAGGLDGVPEADRVELQRLFHALGEGAAGAVGADGVPERCERELEERRMLNAQVEALIVRIRKSPGLQRFLMPASFETLATLLPKGFVVILNVSRFGYQALLMSSVSAGSPTSVTSLELEPPPGGFDSDSIRDNMPREFAWDTETSTSRVTNLSSDSTSIEPFEAILSKLWKRIAKPVINSLGLKVSSPSSSAAMSSLFCVAAEGGRAG
jgi:tetratricopeptide (TPR) repeat protein